MYNLIPFLTPGAANVVVELVDLYPEYTHIIICSPDIIKENIKSNQFMIKALKRKGVKIFRLPIFKRSIYNISYSMGALIKLFKIADPDIILSHSGNSALIANSAFRLSHKKTTHLSFVHGWGLNKKWYHKKSDVLSLNRCDRIICVSNAIKDQMISFGIKKEKISVIYYGYSVSSGKFINIHNSFDIPKKHKIILSAIRLVDEKDPDLLLDIAKLCKDLDVTFIIAGDGYLKDHIHQRLEKENIKNVVLLGFRKDINDLYVSSDIFLLTSKYDALPFCIIESLFHGLPIISSDVGGIPEMIENDYSGILFHNKIEAFQAIKRLCEDNALLSKFRLNSKETYNKKFKPEIMKAKLEEIINPEVPYLDIGQNKK